MINLHLELTRHSDETGFLASCLYGDSKGVFHMLHTAPREVCSDAEYFFRKAFTPLLGNGLTYYSYKENKFLTDAKNDAEHLAIAGCYTSDSNDVKELLSILLSGLGNLDIEGTLKVFINGNEVSCWTSHHFETLSAEDKQKANALRKLL